MRNLARFIKTLLIIFIFIIGAAGIIGSGGGSGGGGKDIDNSKFYGDFAMKLRTGNCDISAWVLTIGNDSDNIDTDNYLYLPKDSNSSTYTNQDDEGDTETTTVTVSGDTVIIETEGQWEDDPSQGWTGYYELAYSNSYNNIDIDGNSTEDDPDDCEGAVTGSAIRVGTVGVTIDYSYLQYRTYETATNDKFAGWFGLTKDGIPPEVSDITKVELKNEDGEVVNNAVNVNDLWIAPYYWGAWDDTTNRVEFSGPHLDSGYSVRFSDELPPGNYTYEVTTSDDDIVSATLDYPGKVEIPFVEESSMSNEWVENASGGSDLKLIWDNPEEGGYDRLRIIVYDVNNNMDLIYINVPTDVEEVTIPEDWLEAMDDFFDISDNVEWLVQTRFHINWENIARGYSNWVPITD